MNRSLSADHTDYIFPSGTVHSSRDVNNQFERWYLKHKLHITNQLIVSLSCAFIIFGKNQNAMACKRLKIYGFQTSTVSLVAFNKLEIICYQTRSLCYFIFVMTYFVCKRNSGNQPPIQLYKTDLLCNCFIPGCI